MYTYEDYKHTRDTAWRILIDADAREMPIRVADLCAGMGIRVASYEQAADFLARRGMAGRTAEGDGFAVPGMIFYDAHTSVPRQRFTVAHELGHLVLGHVGMQGLVNREPHPEDNPVETAANGFAARILAPACVLWGCRVRCWEDIARLCDISEPAARYRMARMEVLYARGRFLSSMLERKVYAQFSDFIASNECG